MVDFSALVHTFQRLAGLQFVVFVFSFEAVEHINNIVKVLEAVYLTKKQKFPNKSKNVLVTTMGSLF